MVFGLSKHPEKYEARALEYERKGKTSKAIKNREKAAKLRQQQGTAGGSAFGSGGTQTITTSTTTYTQRTPSVYEAKAQKWEQRGNYTKAQKNREKVWRLQNPQYMSSTSAPQFYNNNRFVGYNVPFNGQQLGQQQFIQGQTIYNAAIVETHVRPTIVEQTTRPERIVEVQPVIHRDIDAPQVRVIEKHVYETVPSTGPNTITRQAIVQETVKPMITEEVQPVIHREVPAPFVEHVQQHVTEHIVRPTVTTKEVFNDATVRPMGVAAGGAPLQQGGFQGQGLQGQQGFQGQGLQGQQGFQGQGLQGQQGFQSQGLQGQGLQGQGLQGQQTTSRR